MLTKFSFVNGASIRFDFELFEDRSIMIAVPQHKVLHSFKPNFNPVSEFGGDADQWLEMAVEELLQSDKMVIDDDFGLVNTEHLDELRNEAAAEEEHVRQESRSDIYI